MNITQNTLRKRQSRDVLQTKKKYGRKRVGTPRGPQQQEERRSGLKKHENRVVVGGGRPKNSLKSCCSPILLETSPIRIVP